MGINIQGIRVEYFCAVLKDGSLIVDQYMRNDSLARRRKRLNKTLLLVLRFLKATTPFVVFIFYFFYGLWSVFCCVLVPGTLALHLLHTLITYDC